MDEKPKRKREKIERDDSGFRCYIANTKLANFLRQTHNNTGIHTLEISGRSSKANVKIKYNLTSDTLLTFFDCAVMDAVLTFYDNGILDFNVRGLMRFMYGRKDITVSSVLRDRICQTLDKLRETEMIIDITDECRMRDIDKEKVNSLANLMKEKDRKKVNDSLRDMFGEENSSSRTLIWGRLLPLDKQETEKKRQQTEKTQQKTKNRIKWRIENAPLLYEYGEKIANQRVRYAPLLQQQKEQEHKKYDTEKRMLIKYYLIHHLEVLRYLLDSGSARANRQRRIRLYDRRDPDIGIMPHLSSLDAELKEGERIDDSPYFARKLRNTCEEIESVLDHFKKTGYIEAYRKCESSDGIICYDITGSVKDMFDHQTEEEPIIK